MRTLSGLLRLTLPSERLDVAKEEDAGRAGCRPFEARPQNALRLGVRLADNLVAVDLRNR